MERDDAIELLKRITKIKTVNGVDDEGKLAEFLCEYFIAAGIPAEVQRIDDRHANVIAMLEGASKKKVIWNGHLDTVQYGDEKQWKSIPSIPCEEAGRLYVRGACDMKGGLAAMAYALGQIKQSGIPPKYTICFVGTCDEEKSGMGAKRIVESGCMKDASMLLIGEPTGGHLGIAQKGCMWILLRVKGVTSHGAYPKAGINAIEYGIKALEELKVFVIGVEHKVLGNATMQITQIKGGIVPNMTPDSAELLMDIRTVPGLEKEIILEKLTEICEGCYKETLGKAKFEIEVLNERRAITCDEENLFIKMIEKGICKNGQAIKKIGINYFTDASILANADVRIPILLFGPGEAMLAHCPNEFVEIEKYLFCIRVLQDAFCG